MEINKIYQELTGVNIQEQKILWNEHGKGYYGEYLIFKELFCEINNTSKILMNLEIPTPAGKKTEIDLVLIMESGIYVFESKHYKGTIYGQMTDDIWTQWFKTKKSSHFNNPVKQNQYHIDNLKRIFPNVPIYSYIVFTNHEDCTLKIENTNTDNITVCEISSLLYDLNNDIQSRQKILNIDDIENVFRTLIPYAPIMETKLKFSDDIITLNEYIHKTVKECKETKNRLEQDYNKKCIELKNQALQDKQRLELSHKTTRKNIIIVGIIIIIFTCFWSWNSTATLVEKKNSKIETDLKNREEQITVQENTLNQKEQDLKVLEEKYNELIQKFEKVGELTFEDTVFNSSFYEIDKLTLNDSKTKKNVVEFACKLYSTQSEYKIALLGNSKIHVLLTNGELKEYDLKINFQPYQKDKVMPKRNEINDPNIYLQELSGINKEDIEYIKLSNVGIKKYNLQNVMQSEIVKENFEIEIYKK